MKYGCLSAVFHSVVPTMDGKSDTDEECEAANGDSRALTPYEC